MRRPDHSGNRTGEQRTGLFLWLSGADVAVLARCPGERRKFLGLGGVILTTAVLAGVSATFALATAARAPLWIAVPVGVAWGAAIMNLDRWLVTAAPRRDRWWQNLVTTVPRLLMALVIGTVISTPLVLWLFQREINTELDKIHQRKSAAFQEALQRDPRFVRIGELEKELAEQRPIADGLVPPPTSDPSVSDLETQYKELDQQYQAALKDANCELDGSCGSNRTGPGPIYQRKLAAANEIKARRDAVGAKLDGARAAASERRNTADVNGRQTAQERVAKAEEELARLQREKQNEERQFDGNVSNDTGLLASIGALSELTGRNGTLRLAYLLLLVFITLIEVLPVLVKFLMNVGPPSPYDSILAGSETADVQAAAVELAHRRQMTKLEFELRAEREQESLRDVVDRMVRVEREVYDKVLDDWEREQLGLAGTDPGSYTRGWRPWRRDRVIQGEYDEYPEPEVIPQRRQPEIEGGQAANVQRGRTNRN